MKSSDRQINELIEITRDGQHFYQHVLNEVAVEDAQMQQLFRDMLQSKAEVIQILSSWIAEDRAQPALGGTLTGKLREAYADTRARFARNETALYVSQLEAAESRILHAFESALKSTEADVRCLAEAELPRVRACHDLILTLKKSLQ